MQRNLVIRRNDGMYLTGDYKSWDPDVAQAQRFIPGAALNACVEEWRRYGVQVVNAETSTGRPPPNVCQRCKQVIPPRLAFCVTHNNALSLEHRKALLSPATDAADREQKVKEALAYLYRQERANAPAGPTSVAVEEELRQRSSARFRR